MRRVCMLWKYRDLVIFLVVLRKRWFSRSHRGDTKTTIYGKRGRSEEFVSVWSRGDVARVSVRGFDDGVSGFRCEVDRVGGVRYLRRRGFEYVDSASFSEKFGRRIMFIVVSFGSTRRYVGGGRSSSSMGAAMAEDGDANTKEEGQSKQGGFRQEAREHGSGGSRAFDETVASL